MDILLYVRSGENEELRYAIRSWRQNLNFRHLYVVGGPIPRWLLPDTYVENPPQYPMMKQCYDNLVKALADDRLSGKVLILMDDVFVLKPFETWERNFNRGTLEAQATRSIERRGKTPYNDLVCNTDKTLRLLCDKPLSFESHAPFLCDRRKLLKILKDFGADKMSGMLWRSLYGNLCPEPSTFRLDRKIFSANQPVPNTAIISTNEASFAGRAGEKIRQLFPSPSRHELYGQ